MDSGSKTGLWTAIPYASMWACSIVFSLVSDFLIRKKILSTATVRKVLMINILYTLSRLFIDFQHYIPPWTSSLLVGDCDIRDQ